MFSSQISLERSGVPRATEVLGQEFLDQISPEGHRFMFYLFRLESSVEFLFMFLFVGVTPTDKNFTVVTAFMRNEQVIITDRKSGLMPVIDDQNVLAKLTELTKDEELVDIKAFWKTLEIGNSHPSARQHYMDSEMCSLTDLLNQISVLTPVLPDDPGMKLTSSPEIAVTKWQKKTNSTKIDK
ncbi:hypothetical protein M9H77_07762 [Catharanthus roseus]|uniref:Uncharacterized protein n=1 Tax=Catharanthus roseus TaxID=4058 RepID=A0ACC0BW42_CATRO|nr:hypothetical protein M9H77_07762 [Catharanthus roseus]